jgi:hypothetical protein
LKELHNLLDVAVKDKSSVETKQMSTALHLLQVNNEFVHHQNKGLRTTIATKKRHQRKGKPLDLQQHKEFESAGVFWSPSRVREAEACNVVVEREKEAEKLWKADSKKLKASAALY